MTLRETIRNLMVNIHEVTPELAASWVSEMEDSEILFRFRQYQRVLREIKKKGRP